MQGGRADSIYSNLYFEFKKPNKFRTKKGISEALDGRDEKDRGLKHYLVNFTIDDSQNTDNDYFKDLLKNRVGVGFDGSKFIFARYKDSSNALNIFNKNKTNKFPSYINKSQKLSFDYEVVDDFEIGLNRLLLLLRSTKRKRLSADELLLSFSATTELTQNSITYLYELLDGELSRNTRIKTLFDEWYRIFGLIYGKQETDFTKFKDELRQQYDLPRNLEINKSLFVIQTYYSIVIKLLIHNLLESLSDPTSPPKLPSYKNELTSLFTGDFYKNYNIDNFFEIHFFEWFILSESLDINFVNKIILELNTFETTASIIKPEIVSDVLKSTYSNLIPKDLRHLMGEYYTPDWLVDFTIEKSKYDFEKNTTILDPTCGSGTFLIHLIKEFKSRHIENVESNKLIKLITNNIVGFDINPIAVISAKANYILSLGDITKISEKVTIPIYMCDSILVPTVHAKQSKESKSIKIETVAGLFELPVFKNREQNDYFLQKISSCILEDYTTFDEFHDLIKYEKIIEIEESQLEITKSFFDKLHTLHLSGKNGFWPIILKNSFAPLFSHDKFDVVIGNPPWISWKSMSDTYRKSTLDIWLSYGIFEKNAYDSITTHDDFAMAVTYVSIDHYLKPNGLMAFVLPQTFVKSSKGGEGFRKFEITRDNLSIHFSINEVYDMLKIKPFRGYANNRTSVYVFEKNKKMKYPMNNYYVCESSEPIRYTDSLETVNKKMSFLKQSAKPISDSDIKSPWFTGDKLFFTNINNVLGQSDYKARKGIEPCGAKGIYLLNVNKKVGNDVEIENLIERSRLDKAKKLGIRKGVVETEFIYPMVGGRNFNKWGLNSTLYMIVPHANTGKAIYKGIDEKELKTKYSKTYKWLFYFKDLLLETRIRSGKFFNPNVHPFYRLDNLGPYTFDKYKVIYKEQSKNMEAAVISTLNDKYLGTKQIVVDSKVLYLSFDNEHEANYVCAILNSSTIGKIINGYTIDVQKGVDILKNIKIPKYDSSNKLHKKLASLSIQAHQLYNLSKPKDVESIELKIEKVVEDFLLELK